MQPLDAILLGLVQGIAEFLPISSSGHLIVAREFLGLQVPDGLAVDAVLQLVTVLAVVVYFRKDLLELLASAWCLVTGRPVPHTQKTLLFGIVAGTVPAVVAGLLLEDVMDTVFRSATLVAWVLIAASGLLLLAEWVHARRLRAAGDKLADDPDLGAETLTLTKAACIGCFQALALVPGVSRSGATISGAMLLGLPRAYAARFAFLLSVPVILGAGSKKLLELGAAGVPQSEWMMIGLASVVAFGSGLASIHYLLRFLRDHSLVVFVVYRVALGVLLLVALS